MVVVSSPSVAAYGESAAASALSATASAKRVPATADRAVVAAETTAVATATVAEVATIRGGEVTFQLLKYFRITCFAPCLTFMAGAMPKLQNLNLQMHENGMEPHGP